MEATQTKSCRSFDNHTTATESWVDLRVVAKHIGFGYQTTRRRVMTGELPGKPFKCGKKTYWRCRLSDVDDAIKSGRAQ
jgi:hypothetical protein